MTEVNADNKIIFRGFTSLCTHAFTGKYIVKPYITQKLRTRKQWRLD